MVSILLIQWGIIGLFAGIYLLIGFFRGASKSIYQTIVTILVTILLLWGLSYVTVGWFFSPENFQSFLISNLNFLPDDIVQILSEASIAPILILVADLVIRIVAYFILLPIIQFLLKLLIFNPIYKKTIKPALINSSNKKRAEKARRNNKVYKPQKSPSKNIFSRLIGSLVSAVQGFFVGTVFLLPILVILGSIGTFSNQQTNGGVSNIIPEEFQVYLEQVSELNEQGLGAFLKQIKITDDKSLDEAFFDLAFTFKIKDNNDNQHKIYLSSEFNAYLGIAKIAIDKGYLDSDFDFNTVGKDNLPDIEAVFEHLQQSNLLGYMIPTATRFGVINYLDINIYERESSQAGIEAFENIDWKAEFGQLYEVVAAVFELGDLSELQALLDPNNLQQLSEEELSKIRNVLSEFGNLQILSLTSVALDYATTLSAIQDQITWIEQANKESYLYNRFEFIINNPNFFIGEDGEIQKLLLIVDALISSDYDANIIDFLADYQNIEALLAEKYGDWAGNVIDQLAKSELLLKLIPIGIDYGAYSVFDEEDEQQLAEQIVEVLQNEEVKWDDEISNIGNIYKEVATLGISQFFGDQPNIMELADNVLANHLPTVREITHLILNESEVVNDVLTIASPTIVDTLVSDEQLRDLIHQVLGTDTVNNTITFNFGQEVANILTIIETFYEITTLSEVQQFSELSTTEIVNLVNRFGKLTTTKFNNFDQAILNSQILSRLGKDGLIYLDEQLDFGLYATDNFALNQELSTILNLGFVASKFIYTETLNKDFEDIDFSLLLDKAEFKQYLTVTSANKHSSFLMTNIAHFAMRYKDEPTIVNYITIPTSLLDLEPTSDEWHQEINNFISGVIEIGASIGRDNNFKLSYLNINNIINDPTSIDLEFPLAYSNKALAEQVFGQLGNSLILRTSAVKLTEQFTSNLNIIPNYTFTLPTDVIEDDILKTGELESLIYTISVTINDFADKANIQTIGQLIDTTSMNTYINGFNDLEASTINAISENNFIRGLFSDAILNEDVQDYGRSFVNDFNANITVSDNFLAFRRDDNKLSNSDFYDLLRSIQALKVTDDLVNDLGNNWVPFVNNLSDTQLDQFFTSRIISEIIDFVVTDEGIHIFASDLIQTQYSNIQNQISQLANYNPNFMGIFSSISEVKGDYDLFDTKEIKVLIKTFQALEINSTSELSNLSKIPTIHQKLRETEAFETLFTSTRLHNAVSALLKDEDKLTGVATAVSDIMVGFTNVDHQFNWQDFDFSHSKYELYNVENVKVSELKAFALAATRYNFTSGVQFNMLGIQTLINNLYLVDGYNTRPIDDMLDSKLLVAIFDKALNFEHSGHGDYAVEIAKKRLENNATFNTLELSADILSYDDSAYTPTGVITNKSIKDLFYAYTLLDLSSTINFNTIYQTTQNGNFDNIFESIILHSLVSNVLSSSDLRAFGQEKVNNAQSYFNIPETFFIFEKDLRENEEEDGLIKVSELSNLIVAANALGLTNMNSINSVGVETVTDLLNRNIVDGKDDLDRVLDSGFIYIVIAKAADHPGVGTRLGEIIADRLNVAEEDINTTPPSTVIGTIGIENGRLTKQEIRQSLTSISLLGLTGIPNQSSLGVDLFLDLVDPSNPNDDMSLFLQSDYIYVIMARQFEANYFSSFVKGIVEDIFGEPVSDINMGAPSDAKAIYADENLLTRTELRSIFVSTKLLNLTGIPSASNVSLSSILGLIDQNEEAGVDDLDRFLESKYIQDKFSKLLLSRTVKEKVANGKFDHELIVLPNSSMNNNRMTKQEIYDLLNGLDIIGIDDFNNVNVSVEDVLQLTQTETDELLQSTYLYVVMDLTLKEEDAIEIPNHALVLAGEHTGRILKTEIKKLIETAQYLNISDLNAIDTDDISLLDLKHIIEEIDSAIINRLISKSIIESLEGESILIPTTAYLDTTEKKDLTTDELSKMIEALYHLNGDSYVGNIENILPVDANNLNADLLEKLVDVESLLIHRLISHHIIIEDLATPNSLAKSGDDYYDAEAIDHDLHKDELDLLIKALKEIGGDITNIDAEAISIEKLDNIYQLNSSIINRQISKAIIESLTKDGQNNIPSTVYVDVERKDIDYVEMGYLIATLSDLAGGDDTKTISEVFPIDNNLLTGTVLQNMVARNSLIIYRIISSSIIEQNLETDETYAEDAEYNYDPEAINLDIKVSEITKLVDAIALIGGNINNVDSDNITISMLTDLVDLDSKILDRIISNTITDNLDQKDIPSYSYRAGREDIEHLELVRMVLALQYIAGVDQNVLISDILPIDDADLTRDLMRDLVDTESQIILRVISSGIISAAIDTPESILAEDPDITNDGVDIRLNEINHIIEVMDILAITNITTVEDEITVAKLKALDEIDLNNILAEPETIIYFIIDKVIQDELNSQNPLIIPGLIASNKTTNDFIDGADRIKRDVMKEALDLIV